MRTSLTDGPILLRRWRREDAPAVLELARESADDIGRWMMWTDSVTDLTGAEQFIAERLSQWDNDEGYCFVAVSSSTGSTGLETWAISSAPPSAAAAWRGT